MKNIIITLIVLLMISFAIADESSARQCTVCHSKNPKMVSMHTALGFKDCAKCHASRQKKSPEEQKALMSTDERCAGCHVK